VSRSLSGRWRLTDGASGASVDGERYFKTGPLRASFVKPDKVEVGDFPELDPFADDDDEEMEM
jgi:tubulin-folding cofactor B